MSKLRMGCIVPAVLILLLVGGFLLRLWRGTPLPAEAPARIPGFFYVIRRDPVDRCLKVYNQAGDASGAAGLVADHSTSGESNCNIIAIRLNNGKLEYEAMHQGSMWLFRDGAPIAKTADKPMDLGEPVGVENRRGSLAVDGQVVVPYTGEYDFKWSPGYVPRAWAGDRYLIFGYSGYSNGSQAFLANVLGLDRNRSSNYVWDRQTGKIHRFMDGYQFVFVPVS